MRFVEEVALQVNFLLAAGFHTPYYGAVPARPLCDGPPDRCIAIDYI
jgi:hypothetical protein